MSPSSNSSTIYLFGMTGSKFLLGSADDFSIEVWINPFKKLQQNQLVDSQIPVDYLKSSAHGPQDYLVQIEKVYHSGS